MIVSIYRRTFDCLMSHPYSELATYLAYLFLQRERGTSQVSQYAIYKHTRLDSSTVRTAWPKL